MLTFNLQFFRRPEFSKPIKEKSFAGILTQSVTCRRMFSKPVHRAGLKPRLKSKWPSVKRRTKERVEKVLTNSSYFQKLLQAKRDELLSGSSDRDEIRIENAAEDFDRLQQRMNREVAIRNLDRESKLLKDVEDALARVEHNAFGICLDCEEEIPEKRLKAVPWASHCIHCQERLDRRRALGESESGDDMLQSAA